MFKKIKIGTIELYFVWASNPRSNFNLKSKIEIKFSELKNTIENLNYPKAHFICEGGWYFNKPERLIKVFGNYYRLFYIILSPSIQQLKENYIKRHPRSKKDVNVDAHWEKYESIVWGSQFKTLRNLKKKLGEYSINFYEFKDELLNHKVKKIERLISVQSSPTIFIITGPNCSGKSTLMYSLLKKNKII